jgi:hypothetical protein
MPKFADQKMREFMSLVKNANWLFRESASSLRELCQLLRQDATTARQVSDAIGRINGEKQRKYKSALDYVRMQFPGMQLLGLPGAVLAQQAQVGFQAREAKIKIRYMQRHITQTQQYPPAYPPPLTRNYAWDVKLTFEDRPTTVVAKPVIRYREKQSDPHGHIPSKQELAAWKAQIQLVWKAKFQVGVGVDRKLKDVVFDISFVEWDAVDGAGAYSIDVVNVPIQEAQAQKLIARGEMAHGSSLQTQDWRVKQRARGLLLDGASLGTPHMGQWGVQDMQAIIHEFGHAIGCPDEYLVTAHNVNLPGYANTYNLRPFSTESIMNDTAKGRIFQRHFAVVAELYQQFMTPHGGAPPPVAITQPAA